MLTEISDVYLHSISQGNKVLLKNDKLTLSKLPESKFIITIGDFVHKFDSDTGLFFKVHHGACSSYFFTPNNTELYAITMSRYHGTNDFEEQINKLTEIYSY